MQPSREAVVCVHGLWVNGLDMGLLRHRLGTDYATFQFSYNSVSHSPSENAVALQEYVSRVDHEVVHFVGHSLGGLVIRQLFSQFPGQKPGRIVTLGTPHRQSHSARQLSEFTLTRMLLGKSIDNGLLGDVPEWNGGRELGSIAGTLRFGMGVIIPGLPLPNDGTVALEETHLEGMQDHTSFRVSHFGLLFSAQVCAETINFLQNGRFG